MDSCSDECQFWTPSSPRKESDLIGHRAGLRVEHAQDLHRIGVARSVVLQKRLDIRGLGPWVGLGGHYVTNVCTRDDARA